MGKASKNSFGLKSNRAINNSSQIDQSKEANKILSHSSISSFYSSKPNKNKYTNTYNNTEFVLVLSQKSTLLLFFIN